MPESVKNPELLEHARRARGYEAGSAEAVHLTSIISESHLHANLQEVMLSACHRASRAMLPSVNQRYGLQTSSSQSMAVRFKDLWFLLDPKRQPELVYEEDISTVGSGARPANCSCASKCIILSSNLYRADLTVHALMCLCATALAPILAPEMWKYRVLENKLPVMFHLWDSKMPERHELIAPAVDDIAVEFMRRMDVVRTWGMACCQCLHAPALSLPSMPCPIRLVYTWCQASSQDVLTQYTMDYYAIGSDRLKEYTGRGAWVMPSVYFYKVEHCSCIPLSASLTAANTNT